MTRSTYLFKTELIHNLHRMSTSDIKQRLAKMSQTERDDVKAFLDSLENDGSKLSSEEIEELDRRFEYYKANPQSAKPWNEVVGQWKK